MSFRFFGVNPAFSKISDIHLVNVIDDTKWKKKWIVMNKNLEFTSCPSAAVLSRHNLINVTTYREILCQSIRCWLYFGREVLITLVCKRQSLNYLGTYNFWIKRLKIHLKDTYIIVANFLKLVLMKLECFLT